MRHSRPAVRVASSAAVRPSAAIRRSSLVAAVAPGVARWVRLPCAPASRRPRSGRCATTSSRPRRPRRRRSPTGPPTTRHTLGREGGRPLLFARGIEAARGRRGDRRPGRRDRASATGPETLALLEAGSPRPRGRGGRRAAADVLARASSRPGAEGAASTSRSAPAGATTRLPPFDLAVLRATSCRSSRPSAFRGFWTGASAGGLRPGGVLGGSTSSASATPGRSSPA